jgi:hypothetical protein
MRVVKFLSNMGLFIGQSKEFFAFLTDLAEDADAAYQYSYSIVRRVRARRAAEPYPVLVSGVSWFHGISPLEIPAPRQH